MAKGGLKLVGGTAALDAEPPAEIEDSPRALALQALAADPVMIFIGFLGADGKVDYRSNFADPFEDLVFLRKLERLIDKSNDGA